MHTQRSALSYTVQLTHAILFAALVLNLCMAVWHIHGNLKQRTDKQTKSREYSYIGEDYPLELPLEEPLDAVAMGLDETVHFAIDGSDPSAEAAWRTTIWYPPGLGRVRLGPDHRIFVLGWYHELHCLHALEFAAAHPEREEAKDDEHLHHCLNYLRQALLCEASGTLEKGDFLDRDFEHQPQGDIVICRDWERLFEVHAQNLREWVEWLHHWNR